VSAGLRVEARHRSVHHGFDDITAPRNRLEYWPRALSLAARWRNVVDGVPVTSYSPRQPAKHLLWRGSSRRDFISFAAAAVVIVASGFGAERRGHYR
jgi:hypothetical protein